MSLILSYIPITDTYYYPNKELYIKRWMFLYADPQYLAHVLDISDVSIKDRDALFLMLGQENDSRPDFYQIEFYD